PRCDTKPSWGKGRMKQSDTSTAIGCLGPTGDPQAYVAELVRRYPPLESLFTLLARCGDNLAEVLRGECEPLELLLFEDDCAALTALYRDPPFTRFYNTLVQQAVGAALEELPRDRTVRILEIGAGTGGTTAYLLPDLSARPIEYLFTDLSRLFTSRAKREFAGYPFLEYRVLDIEKDPSAQGYAPHEFDLIVAAEVLHATADL